MHNVLACVFDGDETPLRALIENPRAYEYASGCAGLQTYPSLMHAGRGRKFKKCCGGCTGWATLQFALPMGGQ